MASFLVDHVLGIEVVYTLIVVVSALIIHGRTRRLYALTGHAGIGAFRSAFLYFALGFFVRFCLVLLDQGVLTFEAVGTVLTVLFGVLTYYFLCVGAFSLVYSMTWKQFSERHRILLLHAASLVIALGTVFYMRYLMYVAVLGGLLYAITIAYGNYLQAEHKNSRPSVRHYLQAYFIGLILVWLGFAVNFLGELVLPSYPLFLYVIYSVTTLTMLLMLYGVLRVVQWPRNVNV